MKDRWFSRDGRNMSGYNQIGARLDYLEIMNEDLTSRARAYEIRVIKSILEEMPELPAKQRFRERLAQFLKK